MKTWLKGGLIGGIWALLSPFLVWIPILSIFAIPLIGILALIEYIIERIFDVHTFLSSFQYGANITQIIVSIIIGFIIGSIIGLIIQKVRK